MASAMRDIIHLIQEEGNHSHVHSRQVPGLVDRDEDNILPRRYLEVGWFWGFDTDGKKDWASAGRGDPEI